MKFCEWESRPPREGEPSPSASRPPGQNVAVAADFYHFIELEVGEFNHKIFKFPKYLSRSGLELLTEPEV